MTEHPGSAYLGTQQIVDERCKRRTEARHRLRHRDIERPHHLTTFDPGSEGPSSDELHAGKLLGDPITPSRRSDPGIIEINPLDNRPLDKRVGTPQDPGGSCDLPGLSWWRGQDLNLRPSGYEPDELPNCSHPRRCGSQTLANDLADRNQESDPFRRQRSFIYCSTVRCFEVGRGDGAATVGKSRGTSMDTVSATGRIGDGTQVRVAGVAGTVTVI